MRAGHSATTSSRSTSLELRKRHPADAVLNANSGIETSSEEVWLLFFVLLLTRQQLQDNVSVSHHLAVDNWAAFRNLARGCEARPLSTSVVSAKLPDHVQGGLRVCLGCAADLDDGRHSSFHVRPRCLNLFRVRRFRYLARVTQKTVCRTAAHICSMRVRGETKKVACF